MPKSNYPPQSDSSVTSSDSSESSEEDISRNLAYQKDNDGNIYWALRTIPESHTAEYTLPTSYKGIPIKRIVANAFRNANDITSLTIPSTYTEIDASGLSGLSQLETLTTPFIGETIDDEDGFIGAMFGYATGNYTPSFAPKLKKIIITEQENIPSSALNGASTIEYVETKKAVKLGSLAFAQLEKCTQVILNDGLIEIGPNAFGGDELLATLNIPSSVTTIANQAFRGTALTQLNLPKALTSFTFYNDIPNLEAFSISEENANFSVKDGVLYNKDVSKIIAFPKGKDASSFVLPSTVTTIGMYAFDEINITSIDLTNVVEIGESAFYGSGLTSVSFGNALSKIKTQAFYNCRSLASVSFANEVNGDFSFEDGLQFCQCVSLTSITLPSYITSIPSSCFVGCSNLSSITLNGELVSIGNLAFSKTAITSLSTKFADSASIGSNIFQETPISSWYVHFVDNIETYPTISLVGIGATPKIYTDSSSISQSLKTAWESLASLIDIDPSTIFTIDNGTLVSYFGDDASVTIPSTVTSIGKNAFNGKTNLKYVSIPSSVTSIASEAFSDNTNLLAVRFEHDDLSSLTFGGSLYTAFSPTGIKNQPIISLKEGVSFTPKQLGLFTEEKVSNDELDVDFENNIVFDSTRSEILSFKKTVTDYTLPKGIKKIHDYAFKGNKIETIDFGDELESIGNGAFDSCSKLQGVSFPKTLTSIGSSAFMGCTSITSISFDDSPTAIGENAFQIEDCEGITELNLGKAITSIGAGAFANLRIQEAISIIVPKTATIKGVDAFDTLFDTEEGRLFFETTVEEMNEKHNDYYEENETLFAEDLASYVYGEVYFYSEESKEYNDYGYWHYVDEVATPWQAKSDD